MTPASILVTGASGYLGTCLVERLVRRGYAVRALVRANSDTRRLEARGVELAYGDLVDEDAVARAARGQSIVVHAGAGTSGSDESVRRVTVEGTRNVLRACDQGEVRKLVYISSCSVYDVVGQKAGSLVSEDSPLERQPARRGAYSASKQEAEGLVAEALDRDRYAVTILRPGLLYGRGAAAYPPMIGMAVSGTLVVFGDGRDPLPLTHVDNLVDAIVLAIDRDASGVFNVVDEERVTKNAYVDRIVRPRFPRARVLHVPMNLLKAATWLQERTLAIVGMRPFLTLYRLTSSQRPLRFSSERIKGRLGWRAGKDFDAAARESRGGHDA